MLNSLVVCRLIQLERAAFGLAANDPVFHHLKCHLSLVECRPVDDIAFRAINRRSNILGLEMKELLTTIPQTGCVEWIGVRPARQENLVVVPSVDATITGLSGDRFSGGTKAKRQITLIQQEHLEAIMSILGLEALDPGLVRRNIVVSGINLQALKDQHFKIGEAVLYGTGNCPPCSRMEENLGPGGYCAMRGHGGITAYVDQPGKISVGDSVTLEVQSS